VGHQGFLNLNRNPILEEKMGGRVWSEEQLLLLEHYLKLHGF
jgi:hypothetical protein